MPGGPQLGTLTLTGSVDFEYVNRDPSMNPDGTFTTNVTSFDLMGMFNGKSFEVEQDPSNASTGSTSINQTSVSPVEYTVSSDLTIFALYNFNNQGFMTPPGPPGRMATLTAAVPEPGYTPLAGVLVIALLALASRRRQIQ